jgi:hypothetical protein
MGDFTAYCGVIPISPVVAEPFTAADPQPKTPVFSDKQWG